MKWLLGCANVRARMLCILKKEPESIIKLYGGFSGTRHRMPPIVTSPKACEKWGSILYSCSHQGWDQAREIYPMKWRQAKDV